MDHTQRNTAKKTTRRSKIHHLNREMRIEKAGSPDSGKGLDTTRIPPVFRPGDYVMVFGPPVEHGGKESPKCELVDRGIIATRRRMSSEVGGGVFVYQVFRFPVLGNKDPKTCKTLYLGGNWFEECDLEKLEETEAWGTMVEGRERAKKGRAETREVGSGGSDQEIVKN